MQATDNQPWYKEPWPFILIGITGLGVVAGTTLAVIGLSNPPEIVRGEFGSLAKFVVDNSARVEQARSLGLVGRLSLEGETIVLKLAAAESYRLPDQLMVQFQHPVSSQGDSVVLLTHRGDGDYQGTYGTAPHARAHVMVTDLAQTWSLAGRLEAGATIAVEARRP